MLSMRNKAICETTRPSKVGLLGLAIGMLLFGAIGISSSGHAEAKGGPNAPASSRILNQSDPHLGDWVTLSYSVPANVSSPRIQIVCYQGGALVYGEAGPATQSFLLGGAASQWLTNGGAATCTATLYQWDWHPTVTFVPYASIDFTAGGAR